MSKQTSTPEQRQIVKLERAVIKAALARYREWLKENPEGLVPKNHPRANKLKAAWEMIAAAKALYEARK